MTQARTVQRSVATAMFLSIGWLPGRAVGQVVRASSVQCDQCRIERREVLRFGLDEQSQNAAPHGLILAIRTVSGQLVGTSGRPQGGPVVVAGHGKSARVLGSTGKGPGEYVQPTLLARWLGDTILVLDPPAGRLSVLTPELKFARTVPFPISAESWVSLSNGDLVVNATVSSKASAGQPLHRISKLNQVARSFGADTASAGSSPDEPARFLATDGQSVWTAPSNGRYVLEQWNPISGRRLHTIIRDAPFFPARQRWAPLSPSTKPRSTMGGIVYDRGVIWALTLVADEAWARGLTKTQRRDEAGNLRYQVDDGSKVYDTMVEAFDAATGQLLASRRFEEFMGVLLSQSGMAIIKEEDQDGAIISRFVSFELLGRR